MKNIFETKKNVDNADNLDVLEKLFCFEEKFSTEKLMIII